MTRPCAVCGAQVTVRRAKSGRAYTMCNASDDAQACGARVVYGTRHSRELLAPAAEPTQTPARRQPAAARAARPPAAGPRQPPKPRRAPDAPTAPQEAPDGFGSLSDW